MQSLGLEYRTQQKSKLKVKVPGNLDRIQLSVQEVFTRMYGTKEIEKVKCHQDVNSALNQYIVMDETLPI